MGNLTVIPIDIIIALLSYQSPLFTTLCVLRLGELDAIDHSLQKYTDYEC